VGIAVALDITDVTVEEDSALATDVVAISAGAVCGSRLEQARGKNKAIPRAKMRIQFIAASLDRISRVSNELYQSASGLR
jgi:hypothetical protein